MKTMNTMTRIYSVHNHDKNDKTDIITNKYLGIDALLGGEAGLDDIDHRLQVC